MDIETQKKLLELVKKNYEEIADKFNETRKKHLEPLWSELVNLARQIKDGSKVLDVGCGNGRLLEAFKNKEIKYLGVDSNEKLIELARSRFPKFQFTVGDILELGKIPEINFNFVFCVAVLHHLPGTDLRVAALKQLKNKIISDGKIIITVWNLWSQIKFRKLIFKFLLLKLIKKNKMDLGDLLFDWKNSAGQAVSQRYYHAFTKRELKKISKQAGLKIERLYQDKYNYYAVLT
ncbi:methyltransferase domain-containing protein, partial [Candidatus Falkowbacteria bacterium]|nr:methyltransferase domain-containing protein [Candidatus Falkowbacteria bacterium]